MEHLIAKLLEDFENGKMDRRQLLQAVAFSATAAFAASCAPTAGADGKGFKATAVNHAAYHVADYARARDFYVELFGMRVYWDDGKQCQVEFGDPAAPDAIIIRTTKPGEKAYVNHLAFSIANFMANKAAVKAEMERRGLEGIRPDTETGWLGNDPAGYPINIMAEKGHGMFPGASGCEVAASAKCQEGWAAGQKNLNAIPKPSGKGFKATSFSYIVLNVPDIPKEREFYRDFFGMKEIYCKLEEPNSECFLRFGNDALYLRKSRRPDNKPYVDHFAITIDNWNKDAVEAELKSRGLDPQPDSKYGFTIHDPDGYAIQICAKGLQDYVGKTCGGHVHVEGCPGGSTGL
jgi:catechol 2,3-dioxygenase-like lactoylglutathione lyase family enzyme